jgi:hypothetical protein
MRHRSASAIYWCVAFFLSGCSSSSGEPSSQVDSGTPAEDAATAFEDAEPPRAEAGPDAAFAVDSGAPDAKADVGADTDSGVPAIDPSTPLSSLTPSQQGAFCDWMNAELGGYGASFDCGGGSSVSNSQNQMQCVMTRLVYRCSVTVGDVEMCILGEAPTNGCVIPPQACNAAFCGG